MNRKKLLIVEDNPNLGQILKEYLQLKGFDTILCTDGKIGLETYKKEDFDFCIFDVMMPKMDGFTLARKIRLADKNIPIIFLTAKSMKEDTIEGLKIGADDYLTKPFSMEELLLRITAILKRVTNNKDSISIEGKKINLGKLIFSYNESLLKKPSGQVKLTSRENELLKIFCEHINETVNRNYALMQIWKDDSYFNSRSMDVYITKLRKHLSEDNSVKILTIHGQGFKLVKVK